MGGYSSFIRSAHEFYRENSDEPVSKEDRIRLVSTVEFFLPLYGMTYPTGEIDSEIPEIREKYISEGLSAI